MATFFVACALYGASEIPAGRWEGSVPVPGIDLRLVIDLAPDAHGKWAGSAIIPGFGIKGAPLTDIKVEESGVAFAIKGALGDPKLAARRTDADTLTGEFEQAGNKAAFVLRKTGPAQVEPPRQSTPVRKELEGDWQGELEVPGGHKIRAKLTLTNQSAGTAVAQFRISGKEETNLPVDMVTDEGGWLTVDSHEYGIVYEGRLGPEANEITGTFKQGGFEAPIVFHK